MKQRNAAPPELPAFTLPVVGGERTLEQIEALARAKAGQTVDAAELAPCDRPAPATNATQEI